MFTVIVKQESEVTDMDWLKRRFEALYFNAVVVGNQIIVTGKLHTLPESYFMLADLLHRNSPELITFTMDDDTTANQRAIEDGVKSSHSIACSLAERTIREQDPT